MTAGSGVAGPSRNTSSNAHNLLAILNYFAQGL